MPRLGTPELRGPAGGHGWREAAPPEDEWDARIPHDADDSCIVALVLEGRAMPPEVFRSAVLRTTVRAAILLNERG
eukprot:15476032-Alexandrium_andersonii.AAC.1